MYKRHQNEASQSSLLNLSQTPVILRFDFSQRIYGIIFIFYQTVSLEVFCKAAVSTLVEMNFQRKKNDNRFSKQSIAHIEIHV